MFVDENKNSKLETNKKMKYINYIKLGIQQYKFLEIVEIARRMTGKLKKLRRNGRRLD